MRALDVVYAIVFDDRPRLSAESIDAAHIRESAVTYMVNMIS